jgi:hypothetical protein
MRKRDQEIPEKEQESLARTKLPNATSGGHGQPKITDGKTGRKSHAILQGITRDSGKGVCTKNILLSMIRRCIY